MGWLTDYSHRTDVPELYPALPPISTEGYTSSSEDIAELSEKVRQAMIDALVEMANKYEAESQKRLT